MTYVIALPCVDVLDRACIEECPVDCIYEGERMLYIHPDECVDCGACEPVCPVEAIYYEDDVPDQWKDYYKVNVDFFEDLGSPGGASKTGKIGKDHPRGRGAAAAGGRKLTLAARLPAFTWDRVARYRKEAERHRDGIVDLSIGAPVDPVPDTVRAALAAAANAPGYPLTRGTPAVREAAAGWLARRHGVTVSPDAVLPVIGTKEFIAWLPTMLGCGAGDTVVYPALAYPTYDAGARLAGATSLATSSTLALGPQPVRLAWVNSPANPTGQVLPPEHLAKMVRWARERGTILASDECYIEQGWDASPVSVLRPEICGGSARRAARRPLAVQALQHGRLPGRIRHRRPRADRRAARDPAARRDDRARPDPGRDDRRPRRRRARR